MAAGDSNPTRGWCRNIPPVVTAGAEAVPGPPVVLICHECNKEYEDYSALEARLICGTHVCVSCPRCERDLALVPLSAAASVRQEPDWEGVARELYEAVNALDLSDDWTMDGAADRILISCTREKFLWQRIRDALTAFERADGEGERE